MVVFHQWAIVQYPQRHRLKHSMWLSHPLQLCFLILMVHSEPFASALWEHDPAPVPPLFPIANVLLSIDSTHVGLLFVLQTHLALLAFLPQKKNALSLIFTWLLLVIQAPAEVSPAEETSLNAPHPHSYSCLPANITYFYFNISTYHCLILSCPVCGY